MSDESSELLREILAELKDQSAAAEKFRLQVSDTTRSEQSETARMRDAWYAEARAASRYRKFTVTALILCLLGAVVLVAVVWTVSPIVR